MYSVRAQGCMFLLDKTLLFVECECRYCCELVRRFVCLDSLKKQCECRYCCELVRRFVCLDSLVFWWICVYYGHGWHVCLQPVTANACLCWHHLLRWWRVECQQLLIRCLSSYFVWSTTDWRMYCCSLPNADDMHLLRRHRGCQRAVWQLQPKVTLTVQRYVSYGFGVWLENQLTVANHIVAPVDPASFMRWLLLDWTKMIWIYTSQYLTCPSHVN